MSEQNIHDIATNPPQYISGKHLKGRTLAEVMEINPLLPNYSLLIKYRNAAGEAVVTSAIYTRRDDGQSAIETKEVSPPVAEPSERSTFIDVEKGQTFRTLRKMYSGLPPKARERFRTLFRFALAEMQVELTRAGQRRAREAIKNR
jgi:hypothetical protein